MKWVVVKHAILTLSGERDEGHAGLRTNGPQQAVSQVYGSCALAVLHDGATASLMIKCVSRYLYGIQSFILLADRNWRFHVDHRGTRVCNSCVRMHKHAIRQQCANQKQDLGQASNSVRKQSKHSRDNGARICVDGPTNCSLSCWCQMHRASMQFPASLSWHIIDGGSEL